MGDLIKKLRKDAAVSVRDVADQIGVSEQAVYQWETGKRKIPHAYAALILLQFLDADQIAPVIDRVEDIGRYEKIMVMRIVRWVTGLVCNREEL